MASRDSPNFPISQRRPVQSHLCGVQRKCTTWEYYCIAYAEMVLIDLKVRLLTSTVFLTYTQRAFTLHLQCSKDTRVNKGRMCHTFLFTFIFFPLQPLGWQTTQIKWKKYPSSNTVDFCTNGLQKMYELPVQQGCGRTARPIIYALLRMQRPLQLCVTQSWLREAYHWPKT